MIGNVEGSHVYFEISWPASRFYVQRTSGKIVKPILRDVLKRNNPPPPFFSFLLTLARSKSDTLHLVSAKGCNFRCQYRFRTVQFVDWMVTLIRIVIK